MVALQATANLPFKEHELVWDFRLIAKEPNGYSRVLFMAAGIEQIEKYLKPFSEAGFFPEMVSVSSWGLLSRAPVPEGAAAMILRIEERFTEICFCGPRTLYFSRHVDLGFSDVAAGKSPELFEQIKLTLSAYQNEKMGPAPKNILILSPSGIVRDIVKPLQKDMDVSVQNPLENITNEEISGQPEAGVACAAALGLAGIGIEDAPSFLPGHVKDRLDSRSRSRRRTVTVLLTTLAVVSLALAIGAPVMQQEMEIARIQKKREAIRHSLKNAEKKMKSAEAVKTELSNKMIVVDIFDELYRVTPEGISYSNLRLSKSGEVILQGEASDGQDVNHLQSGLLGSQVFRNVTLQQASKRITVYGEVTHFSITATLQKK